MNRRSLPIAAALTAIAALLLTACSGGSDEKPKANDKIAGADQSETTSRSSASPSSAAGRPKIELPDDLKLTFEPEETGDVTKNAVLADGAERMRAVNAAIAGTDPKFTALNFYNTSKALEAASSWVEEFRKSKLTISGSAHYFDRKVTLNKDTSASLTFCADETKGRTKDIKTGKVKKSSDPRQDYVFYATQLRKNSNGVWQTTQIVSKRGATQCMP
ncbi:hypothetical protein J7E87_26105 [Streptomyces sp. ISL-1]|nr:hypothetical protein [Streptomyces sp. ISL-1]